jgi:hypothetical protein
VSYVVITADGELLVRERRADLAAVNEEVGEPGCEQVRLHRTRQFFGFVNDAGLVLSPPLPRNPVGACILASLGSGAHIYAGPVVITGWEERSELSEIRDLAPHLIAFLRHLHGQVSTSLNGGSPVGMSPRWVADVRRYADLVRAAEPRPVQILTGDEALEYLRGGAGDGRS